MKFLILALVLTGCSTTYRGIDYGVTYDASLIKCDLGEPYYNEVVAKTDLEKMTGEIEISWQCEENNGARKVLKLAHYSLERKVPSDAH